MWIITREVNDYNQHGEYFVAAFKKEPTFQQIKDLSITTSDATIGKLTRGGGREGYEEEWYNLHEIKNGEKFP